MLEIHIFFIVKQQLQQVKGIHIDVLMVFCRLESLFGGITSYSMVYYLYGSEYRTQCYKVPHVTLDRCSDPGRAEA